MRPETLKFKLALYLTLALTTVMSAFVALVVWHQRQELLSNVADRVTQLSEVITKSTRFAMLQNQPDYVDRIIRDVRNKGTIDKVRIVSKEGKITHSTDASEIGQTLDRKAEACFHCHQSEKPIDQVPRHERTWTFTTPEGKRMLGSMEVIRNEPSCYTAACHQHAKTTSVLGVLDIVYSLEQIDRGIRANALALALFSLCFVIVASVTVAFFVHRLIQVPLNDLENGARRLASGDLEQAIPVRSDDEFGQLSISFNAMTKALRQSRLELREWTQTLEEKVEKRTHELRAAQAEAVRGEKLASVGLLAAGIAHELNNPLTGVLTFAHLLRQKLPDDSADAEDLDLIIRETKRCAAIIRRLLDFAREKPPEKKFADLNPIIEDTTRIIERPAHLRNIDITFELDPELPLVWVDEDLFKQVIMNLLVNAQHAIEEKGGITVRTRPCREPRSPEPGMPAVPMVEISVIDTGCGIPKNIIHRIFDPFFTSKKVGSGTGLGLSVSHGIVKAHGGAIEVESTAGEGSTFRVFLPIEPPPADRESSGSSQ